MRNLTVVTNELASIFPIIFASVVGRLMTEATRLRLERGATLGSLEQLIGSRIVGATVITLFNFPSFNVLGASLAITWALSPLGTQSLLRTATSLLEPQVTRTNITYFDNSARSELADNNWWGGGNSYSVTAWFRSISTLYVALVSTSGAIKSDTVDLWGNVKIPFLRHTEPVWKNVSYDAGADSYTLAGIPLNNVTAGNTTLRIESS
ncbi:hypothetical protein CSAL01_11978 [Colletotrichum salicis]|uniref:Uncharacterized protein n=1 Tax=Colletotrichum salicis TaxID=1209931 RepID=A0A135UHU6_9PEZI|nr:hypothetical protein CSAL01_11978 [Colletotrichum salicis]